MNLLLLCALALQDARGLDVTLFEDGKSVPGRIHLTVLLTPQFGATVFAGTVLMCLGAAVFAFRRVSRIDPALVFRG